MRQRADGLGSGVRDAVPSAAGPSGHSGRSGASLSPAPTEPHGSTSSIDSCRTSSPRQKHAPLLALSPSAIPQLDQQLDDDLPTIWNAISRAADVVKDGERLENLAWRHWGAARRRRRRSSSATNVTESSMEIATPSDRSTSIPRSPSFERRSFNSKLALLVKDTSFKDWVGDAVKNQPKRTGEPVKSCSPIATDSVTFEASSLAPPDTPVANLEIRLVEPTPVPSRVGSLGGSLSSTVTPMVKPNLVPENITEVPSEAEASSAAVTPSATAPQTRANRRANNRFFIQSSPGKVSDSSNSQPSSIPRVAPSEAEPPQTGSLGSQLRSSGDSASAIVMPPKKERVERRPVSMANMRGRFAGEKARAAKAIAARNHQSESDEWEDEEDNEDDDDDDSDWVDESVEEAPPIATQGRRGSGIAVIPPPAPTPPRTKKERAAEKARAEAEREAQRQRQMFAKQAIFGAPRKSEGLLTRTFRSGKSLVDLTQAAQEEESESGLRRAPTAAQLTTLSSSPVPVPSLLRTKSTVAMPVQSGVSVTSHHQGSTASDERPKGLPDGVAMETSDEESDDDDYLQSEEVRAKLDALAAKRVERERSKTAPQPVTVTSPGELGPNGIVRPLSPTSRRRAIIMREMSESLRKNIIIEREKSSGRPAKMMGPHKRPPPSVHLSRLPTSSSALNLAQYQTTAHGEPLQQQTSNHSDESAQPLERHNSQPNLTAIGAKHTTSPPPQQPNSSSSVSPEQRRRANVLGPGFLRPLTRVEGGINRTHSAAALTGMAHLTSPPSDHGNRSASSGSSTTARLNQLQAPPMQRSSTEGGQDLERARLRRELAKRGDNTDTGYRFHGW